MAKHYLGEEVGSLKESPLGVFFFVKELVPNGNMMRLYEKYNEKCNVTNRETIRENFSTLFYLHKIDWIKLTEISGLSEAKIKYLVKIHDSLNLAKGEINLAVPDFIWLAILFTANTPHNFERIFDEDFSKELKEYGLLGKAPETV